MNGDVTALAIPEEVGGSITEYEEFGLGARGLVQLVAKVRSFAGGFRVVLEPSICDAPYKPLTQPVPELKADLEAAQLEVRAARERALEKQRIEYNADRIKEIFQPGEMVRYSNDREPKKSHLGGGGTDYVIGEIPKFKLKNKLYEVVKRVSPTTYSLKDPETGELKERPAYVTQIARVRFIGTPMVGDEDEDVGAATTTSRVPYHEQTAAQKWKQVKAHSHLVFNDPDDGAGYPSVAQVLEVEHRGSGDDGTVVVWTMIHRNFLTLTTSYKHNMPLTQQRLAPEYVNGRGKSWVTPTKAQLKDLKMVRMRCMSTRIVRSPCQHSQWRRAVRCQNARVNMLTNIFGSEFDKGALFAFYVKFSDTRGAHKDWMTRHRAKGM